MRFQFGSARTWKIELAWLLGSWAFSWALLSQWLGYSYLWQPMLHVQMHNTYFVLPPLLLTALVWLPIATVVTSVRVLAGAFRHRGPNTMLGILLSVWLLLGGWQRLGGGPAMLGH